MTELEKAALTQALATTAPEDDAQIRAIGEGLRSAHDHIEMHKLERSHCKDAARIREGLAAFAAYKKRSDFVAPTERKGEPVPLIWQKTLEGRIEYILQEDANTSGTRIVDIAYSAFMSGAVGKNKDDGGKCDWFNDTKPMVMEAIQQIRSDLKSAQKSTSPQVPEAPEGFALAPVDAQELISRLDRSIAWLERGELLPGPSACIGVHDLKQIRAMLDAARKA